MESTTGYTFTPCVGAFTSPGIDTNRMDRQLLESPLKDTGKVNGIAKVSKRLYQDANV